MAKVSKDDPFPGLPRRSFFGDADGDRKEGRPDPKSGMVEAPAQQPVEPVLAQASPSGAVMERQARLASVADQLSAADLGKRTG